MSDEQNLHGPHFCHEDGCTGEPVVWIRASSRKADGWMWMAFCIQHGVEGLEVARAWITARCANPEKTK